MTPLSLFDPPADHGDNCAEDRLIRFPLAMNRQGTDRDDRLRMSSASAAAAPNRGAGWFFVRWRILPFTSLY